MNKNILRPIIAIACFYFCVNAASANETEQHGSAALSVYYADLYEKLSAYELTDVPFEKKVVRVKRNDSLLGIAERHRLVELDPLHLAAAIYEKNLPAFHHGDASELVVGATITLPNIGDLFIAHDRYEKIDVVGEGLDFNGNDNQMRKGLRWPFRKSLVMIGPDARDELPSNQVVTLTSYRPGSLSRDEDINTAQFGLWGARELSDVPASVESKLPAMEEKVAIVRSTPENSVDELPLAPTLPFDSTVDLQTLSFSEPLEIAEYMEAEAGGDAKVELPAAPLQVEGAPVTASPRVVVAPKTRAATEKKQPLFPEVTTAAVEKPSVTELEPVNKVGSVAPVDIESQSDLPASTSGDIQIAKSAAADEVIAAISSATAVDSLELSGSAFKSIQPIELADSFYLGAPRDESSASVRDISADPLSYPVEWNFLEGDSVGVALNALADYIGYELVSEDNTVLHAYTRALPGVQRSVNGVSVEEGFDILSGRGLRTVFDHVARSVRHVPIGTTDLEAVVPPAVESEFHQEFVEHAGISQMLNEFPAGILNAANRHAVRCDSTAGTSAPDALQLSNRVMGNFKANAPEIVMQNLLSWYDSPTGQKVLQLENGNIDDAELQSHTADAKRIDRITEIYNNTVTGRGIASIAVELDYAGWALSGCRQRAELSGDIAEMQREMLRGQGIKNKASRLESSLREDTLRSMDYVFSSLSDQELTEYAEITRQHSAIYAELQQSVIDAIALETRDVTASLR